MRAILRVQEVEEGIKLVPGGAWPHSRRLIRNMGASEGETWPTYGIARSGCRPNLKSGQTPPGTNLIIWEKRTNGIYSGRVGGPADLHSVGWIKAHRAGSTILGPRGRGPSRAAYVIGGVVDPRCLIYPTNGVSGGFSSAPTIHSAYCGYTDKTI